MSSSASDESAGVRLNDAQRLDWLRLIRSESIGPHGIMQQPSKAKSLALPYIPAMEKIIPAMYALERLHAKLGGQILQNKRDARRLTESMRHVEAVLKLLKPGYSTRSISVRRRKPNAFFKRGTIFRHALEIMRKASVPLTARQMCDQMIAGLKVENPSAADVRTLFGAVKSSLRNNDGKTVMQVDDRLPARWVLKDSTPVAEA